MSASSSTGPMGSCGGGRCRWQRARTATEVVTAAAGGTIATVEEAAMVAAVEAGDKLVCDGSATEEWMIRRGASIGFWSDIRIHYFCPREPRERRTRSKFDNPQRLCSAFSILQLGYEPKKNGEQNAERMRRTLDNWDPLRLQAVSYRSHSSSYPPVW